MGSNRTSVFRSSRFRALAGVVVATPLVAATVVFALARPACETALPARRGHPDETHDLASYLYGPTVAASTANLSTFNHPTFVVDDLAEEPKTAKWASQKWDRAPWIEIRFRGAHDVERVSFRFAGVRERAAWNMRDYVIRCLGGQATRVEVRGNVESAPTHELPCRGAQGVRVEFGLGRNDIARVYEIEVFGR